MSNQSAQSGPPDGYQGYLSLLNNSPPLAVFVKDKERRFQYVNQAFLEAARMKDDGTTAQVEAKVQVVRAELFKYFAEHPEKMYLLEPRQFEQVIADILKDIPLF